jgi:hypothetical protein
MKGAVVQHYIPSSNIENQDGNWASIDVVRRVQVLYVPAQHSIQPGINLSLALVSPDEWADT